MDENVARIWLLSPIAQSSIGSYCHYLGVFCFEIRYRLGKLDEHLLTFSKGEHFKM